MVMEDIIFFLKDNNINFSENINIKYKSYFKSGGEVRLYIEPSGVSALEVLLNYLNKKKVEYKIIGGTTNILFFDEIKYGIFISTKQVNNISFSGSNEVRVECGYYIQDFVRSALVNGLGGIEGIEGIPGTLGGAVFMNAEAYGFSISDFIVSVTCLDDSGKKIIIEKKDCEFLYRESIFKKNPNLKILYADFCLPSIKKEESQKKIEIYHIARHAYQEFSYPTLGSIFSTRKNIYLTMLKVKGFFYYYLGLVLKLIFRNPLIKRIRKYPSFEEMNFLILRSGYFKETRQKISKKTINTLINDGESNSIDMIKYIWEMHCVLDGCPIENELLVWPLDKESQEENMNFLSKIDKYDPILMGEKQRALI